MKTPTQFFILTLLACALAGCLFTEPVFSDSFSKIEPALGGVWAAEGPEVDPRKPDLAVCIPLDDDRYLLHYLAGGKDGTYYEARLVKLGSRSLLQLRVLATLSDGLVKADADRYTLAWIEQEAGGTTLRVRALGGEGVKEKGPTEVKRLLAAPSTDWNSLFGEAAVFRRLPDK